MKIICTKCGLVHNNRATEHLKDRLCCYDTVRLVNYEIEEKVKAAYDKLYPLPCGCGSMITNQEPDRLCCRFTLMYSTQGLKDKAEYEVIQQNQEEANWKGVEPIFKSITSKRDMEIIHKMVRGEAVRKERVMSKKYRITLDCARIEFHKSIFCKGFYAYLYIGGWDDRHLERRTIKEHAQQIGMKLACLFTN
jgi:hypothetical protein